MAATHASRRVRRFPGIRLLSLTIERSRHVERLTANLRLRGADAVYVALAEEFGTMLVTWDAEILHRATGTVPVITPTDWLAAPPPAS